jgi:opacity protein-like surface antigen
MKKILGLLALLTLSTLPALAQVDSTPRLEVGGGFMYRSYNIQFEPRLNEYGWFGTADFNLNRWLGFDADIDEGFESTNSETDEYRHITYMFGPQIYPLGHHRFTPFAHVLFGGSYFTFPLPADDGFTDNAFAFAIGGGLDWRATQHIAVRLGQFDYEQDRNFGGGTTGNPLQNNFKYKAGVIFSF